MKKYLLSAAILIAACISAKAQFSLGVKGGVNFSKINSDNLKSSTVTGYQAGLFARVGGAVYLQPELYLSGTGGEFSSTQNNTTYSGKVTFTNLDVPVLVGVKFGPKNLNIRAMAGPMYTAILHKNASIGDNIAMAYNNFPDAYKNNELGYQAGAGVDIGPITADLRYQSNFGHINDNYNQRQSLWALSVGFKFF